MSLVNGGGQQMAQLYEFYLLLVQRDNFGRSTFSPTCWNILLAPPPLLLATIAMGSTGMHNPAVIDALSASIPPTERLSLGTKQCSSSFRAKDK